MFPLALGTIIVVTRFTNLEAFNVPKLKIFENRQEHAEENVYQVVPNQNNETSVFAESLKPILADPISIKVENTNIDLDIVELGLEDDGQLQNPSEWDLAGWYRNSAKPDQHGNMIINAHYDNSYGGPAGFWELKKVSVGDRVMIKDALGKVYSYQVTNTFYLDINDPKRLEIFENDESTKELTLITCGGVWDSIAGTYNKRLVVKAQLL